MIDRRTGRLWRWSWLVGLLLQAHGPAAAVPLGAARFECTLVDGSVRRVLRDVSADFPAAVLHCRPVSADSPAGSAPLVPPMTAAVATPHPVAAAAVGSRPRMFRYDCALADGSVRRLAWDVALAFRQVVRGCVRVELPDEERLAAPARPTVLPPPEPAADVAGWPQGVSELVHAASARHGLDPHLVSALVHVESRGRAAARSPKGALGLMQMMPATARRYGVNTASQLLDARTNLDAGVRHLRDLLRDFEGRTALALAAYNAGAGAVHRYGGRIPPYAETQSYVRQIAARYQQLTGRRMP